MSERQLQGLALDGSNDDDGSEEYEDAVGSGWIGGSGLNRGQRKGTEV
jgi:hypothetical protein